MGDRPRKIVVTAGGKYIQINTNDSVATPSELYKQLDAEFRFDHDPCPFAPNFTRDGLDRNNKWGRSNFVNPPYSEITKWAERVAEELERGNSLVFLIPFRTYSKYWMDFVFPNATEIRILRKKLIFYGFEKGAPMEMCVVIFGYTNRRTYAVPEEKLIYPFYVLEPLHGGPRAKKMVARRRLSSSKRAATPKKSGKGCPSKPNNPRRSYAHYVYEQLNDHYKFDHDPVKFSSSRGGPREGCAWGKINYVAPVQKVSEWFARAVEEWRERGNASVVVSYRERNTNVFMREILPFVREMVCFSGYLNFTDTDRIPPAGLSFTAYMIGNPNKVPVYGKRRAADYKNTVYHSYVLKPLGEIEIPDYNVGKSDRPPKKPAKTKTLK